MPGTPLSTPLSHLLVAFTIELDNEFERRFAKVVPGRHVRVSLVMWSNFLRFVGQGITVGELPLASGLPKPRMLSTLGGMERWRYVCVGTDAAGKPPESKRDGWGSARGLRSEWSVRPTQAGLEAQEIWPPLHLEIETRWQERFGKQEIRELRASLQGLAEKLEVDLPEYLPIVTGTNGMAAEVSRLERRVKAPAQLSALLSWVLLAYALDFERRSDLSLPLSANVVRVLDGTGVDVRDLPKAAAVSIEATSMALTFLKRNGYVVVEPDPAGARTKLARLTSKGLEAHEAAPELHATVERSWETRFGRENVRRLRAAMRALFAQRDGGRSRLALGLQPYPDGWRASGRYLQQTEAMVEDPRTGLPHYPMVLHRGGWPDGS